MKAKLKKLTKQMKLLEVELDKHAANIKRLLRITEPRRKPKPKRSS